MFAVYVLKSMADGETYVGYTNNFERRPQEHNAGRSRSTKHRAPLTALPKEEFKTSSAARKRELW
jgi:putative endonuclease